jgi:protein gp37
MIWKIIFQIMIYCKEGTTGNIMHDIWNPWHGCIKKSEGCEHCYMYFLDKKRDRDGSNIYRTKNGFDYPLQCDRKGTYKIKSGELIRICMTSDFFLAEADNWRNDAWEIMRKRRDVKFFLLTKRPERVPYCLPSDWDNGWENIFFNVTCENQLRADERIPLLLALPFRHKGIMCAPFIGPISIQNYLSAGQIEQVICGGENYDGSRPCNFDWIRQLHTECAESDVTFCFIETGTNFIKDGKTYRLTDKRLQSEMAYKSHMNYSGRPLVFKLVNEYGEIPAEELYIPHYRGHCRTCGGRLTCNGCGDCGKCREPVMTKKEMDEYDTQYHQ